jgi:hypothetical protein
MNLRLFCNFSGVDSDFYSVTNRCEGPLVLGNPHHKVLQSKTQTSLRQCQKVRAWCISIRCSARVGDASSRRSARIALGLESNSQTLGLESNSQTLGLESDSQIVNISGVYSAKRFELLSFADV